MDNRRPKIKLNILGREWVFEKFVYKKDQKDAPYALQYKDATGCTLTLSVKHKNVWDVPQ